MSQSLPPLATLATSIVSMKRQQRSLQRSNRTIAGVPWGTDDTKIKRRPVANQVFVVFQARIILPLAADGHGSATDEAKLALGVKVRKQEQYRTERIDKRLHLAAQ